MSARLDGYMRVTVDKDETSMTLSALLIILRRKVNISISIMNHL